MTWTDEDEARYQKGKREHFARIAEEDADRAELARQGLAQRCPDCGSHRYSQGTYHEVCDDCGAGQGY